MADVRSAQHFTFSVNEAVDVLLTSLRVRGVKVGTLERANIVIDQATNTVQLFVINPITVDSDGNGTKLN
jgi:hypothetical protein